MTIWKTYYLAHSVADALNVLVNAPETARPVAGGTDLLLDLQQGRHPPINTLVDVTQIPEMCLIEEQIDGLFVGAALPLNQVVASPLVQKHAGALVDAGSLIGGPQVRNTATLGGNVAHALPAADGTISLVALGAQAEIASPKNRRRASMQELFLGPGKSSLDPRREILVGFILPLHEPGQASAHHRIMRPQGVAIAILNMAIWLKRSNDTIKDIRIAVGPAGPTPFRAQQTENMLRGQNLTSRTLSTAAETLLAEARFRTSPHRSTAEYRYKMAAVLLKETFEAAWQRADHIK